jgi:hypothetical protein
MKYALVSLAIIFGTCLSIGVGVSNTFYHMKTTTTGLLRAAASVIQLLFAVAMVACVVSCGVSMDQYGKPTFALDPVALARIIADWQRVNDAKDANVMVVPSPQGQTIVATMPNGSVITETINPSGVIVR